MECTPLVSEILGNVYPVEILVTVYPIFCLFQVDFNALQIETSAEQARQQERERRQNLVNQEKLKKVTTEINGLYSIS
jgi:uncharacterized protein (DUF2225 family)